MTIREALEQSKKQLYVKINDVLTKEVFDVVAFNEGEAIDEIVYKTITSGMYKRREENGGLADGRNIIIDGGAAKNGVLIVRNITPINPYINGVNADNGISRNPIDTLLAPIVETGIGYDYFSPGPRPFTKSVVNKLKISREHVSALKKGLKRRGVKVK